jgi:hypothetical protein
MDANQVIKLSKVEVDLIVDIYKQVAPGRRLNTGCAACVQMALAYIATWLEHNPEPTKVITQKNKIKKNGI